MLTTHSTAQDTSHEANCLSSYHVMLFDLSIGGHHPGYIQHLVQYWRNRAFSGQLSIVVLPAFMRQHADVVACAHENTNAQFNPISQQEAEALPSRKSFIRRTRLAFKAWDLFCTYAKRLNVDHGVLLYLDTAQLPIIFGQSPPCAFSGIYFRPTFHYSTFYHNHKQSKQATTWQQRSQHWRERSLLKQVLKNPKMRSLLCLDPFVVEHIKQKDYFTKNNTISVQHLPDPVKIYPQTTSISQRLKQQLAMASHRRIFILFGALSARKGIYQLLASFDFLSQEDCQQICLLMVGPISPTDKPLVMRKVEKLKQTQHLQVIVKDCFINDKDIQPYFQLADVVLAPYQQHAGMSAILVRAAAAQKPVLSSNYGLMGEITRRYQLGITIDSTQPKEIASGIRQFLTKDISGLYNLQSAWRFSQENSPEQFAKAVWREALSGGIC